MVFKMLRQLKKKLRRKLRWLTLGFFGLIVLTLLLVSAVRAGSNDGKMREPSDVQSVFQSLQADEELSPDQAVIQQLKRSGKTSEVFVRKLFLCGEETERVGRMTAIELERFFERQDQSTISVEGDGRVVVTMKQDGESMACKDGAYIGIDETGTLSLFNGLPREHHIIRTFFQLNIDFLKSALPVDTVTQLYNGIRVMDRDEYNSVLSTFAGYALPHSERASAPAAETIPKP